MNLFHYALYQVAKVYVWIGLRAFYPRTQVLNAKHLRTNGPGIVATNHPNTLMDPFHAVARIRKPVFFLANAGLFKSSFTNWFFSTMYCIPIERPEDIAPGKRVNNDHAFRKINRFLEKGGLLFVAPEGGSFEGRVMKKLKTGAARMTLGAEMANDFALGAHILPVGLAYSAPRNFRSPLVVNVGEPILLRDFQEEYREDPYKAARRVTDILTDRFKSLVVCPADKREEAMIGQIETLHRSASTLSPADHLAWTQDKLKRVQALKNARPEIYQELGDKLTDYQQILLKHGIDDHTVYRVANGKASGFFSVIGLVVSLPFFLYGAINHLFAAGVPALVWRLSNIYITYEATVKYVLGLLTFPLFYYIQFKIVANLVDVSTAWVYLLTLYPAGVIAWKLWRNYQQLAADYRVKRFCGKSSEKWQNLLLVREQCWNEILRIPPNP